MSDEEIISEANASCGTWADREDIDDNWLEDMRSGWADRLDRIYANSTWKFWCNESDSKYDDYDKLMDKLK